MLVWDRFILPRLIDLVMRNKAESAERARLVPLAAGRILEIGIGSALNVPYYISDLRCLVGVDPSQELWRIGRRRLRASAFPIYYVTASAEKLPLADRCVDTILTTWTLCSIPNVTAALAEMRRVLTPGGRLLFIEHGRSPDPAVSRWQDRLTPLWARIAGGCHLNRPIAALLADTGFHALTLDSGYGDGPRVFSYLYRGIAVTAE